MKKNIAIIVTFAFSISVFSQIAIGKSSVSSKSVSLEFGDANKGVVLPWVNSSSSVSGVVDGTMIYDITDHKVKVKYTAGWKDLSVNTTGTTVDPLTGTDGAASQNTLIEYAGARVGIGTGTPSLVSGVLVLEDSNRAMVLPKTASPHLNIVNPAPGLMVYDTVKKQLALFNGNVWTFWKP
ncbi:hypothetical protein [Chryseobacterium sediminis]|uniref:hypothetical protein n=1 Tax=Chryseobacterium sediminis TaxID=1679494 RepID=UPI002865E9B6|nr:hypothetical protein [Chryseobacterium sediminis]MDR6466148.1 hypothetical protein [Chryseobacterium sediminis]